MPRKRKGVMPQSEKQLVRLAKQQAALDIDDVIASCSTSENKATISELPSITDESSAEYDADCSMEKSASSFDEHFLNFNYNISTENEIDENAVEIANVAEHCFSFGNEKVDCIQNENNYEIDDSYDDTYRYSDSDADSNPDNDDLEYLLDSFPATKNTNFINAISNWAKEFAIHHYALKNLQSILNKFTDTVFPKDPRTLLQTPQSTDVKSMDSGEYCHVGLKYAVKKIVQNRIEIGHVFDTLNLFINIDGAPITGKSSSKSIWPILCKDYDFPGVYVIGMYYGKQKPENANNFLQLFTSDATELINDAYEYKEKIYYVKIDGFICDSPAKAFILNTKYPSGYDSCTKCIVEGDYYNAVCFPSENVNQLKEYCHVLLRTDEGFRNLEYLERYQKGLTVLNNLPGVGLVSNVPLDAMHLVYLGAMRQLIRHWIGDKGRHNKTYKLSQAQINTISERLVNLSYVLPTDFNRRCRSLVYWKIWKATEFRHFLLYFGAAILKDVLKKNVYNNFLLLHTSISILSNKKLCQEDVNIRYAEDLLIQFSNSFQKIYGYESVTFNIHNLLHLAKDVKKYGDLQSFSAFPFENYMCSLKKFIRKGEKPLPQIMRRLTEYESIMDIKNQNNAAKRQTHVEKIHYSGLVTNNRDFECQYNKFSFDSCVINVDDIRNNCVMLTDGTIVNVVNICKSNDILYFIGKRCVKRQDLFTFSDFRSNVLGINIVTESDVLEEWRSDMIQAKMFKIPSATNFITYPILHSFV
ncbi:uncharacterized protein LOC100116041 isoform X1 [Nasonia vitripennis]|uniref:Transposase domain-containing protein n=1 Tax=Nasonia vitripennis TaxID=7425 RepID=A0A7M7Q998_NASVI|nr:uncharacterized protein LOC100116041 isoform X1 [Nasonia vitripennis]